MQFRKKPVVIEAVQYAGNGNLSPRGGAPEWFWEALEAGAIIAPSGGDPLFIVTLGGKMLVSPGDWVIRGVKGELYPCKPDIFAATYEPVKARVEPPPSDREGHSRSCPARADWDSDCTCPKIAGAAPTPPALPNSMLPEVEANLRRLDPESRYPCSLCQGGYIHDECDERGVPTPPAKE